MFANCEAVILRFFISIGILPSNHSLTIVKLDVAEEGFHGNSPMWNVGGQCQLTGCTPNLNARFGTFCSVPAGRPIAGSSNRTRERFGHSFRSVTRCQVKPAQD